MTDKTPHEASLCAAEKAYVQYFEYRAMDYAVREYLRTLLSDERVKTIEDIKRIVGVE